MVDRYFCPKGYYSMANYNVTITNGSGTQAMSPGEYNVSATYAPGYDTTTLSPTTYSVGTTAGSGTFTLTASGTLTIIFNETGTAGGTPITSGTVVMTDSTGETQYGSPISIDSSGTATFNNVPYGSAQSAYTLYFKQLTSDSEHNIYSGVFTVGMGAQTQTEYIINTPNTTEQSFTLTDATYSGLPVQNATLQLETSDTNN